MCNIHIFPVTCNWSKDGGLVTEETVTTVFLRVTHLLLMLIRKTHVLKQMSANYM